MFNDMALSNDINEKFKEYLESKALNTGNGSSRADQFKPFNMFGLQWTSAFLC